MRRTRKPITSAVGIHTGEQMSHVQAAHGSDTLEVVKLHRRTDRAESTKLQQHCSSRANRTTARQKKPQAGLARGVGKSRKTHPGKPRSCHGVSHHNATYRAST